MTQQTRDPYEAFRSLAMALENQGVDRNQITDALVCVGLGAACKLGGRAMVVSYLHRLVAHYEAEPDRPAPPSRTQ